MGVACDAQAAGGTVRSPAGGWAAISLRCFALRCAAAPPPQRQPLCVCIRRCPYTGAIYDAILYGGYCTAVLASSTAEYYGAAVLSLYGTAVLRPRLYATSTEPTGTPISTAVREEYGYGCTAAVGGAMAPMLPPYCCAHTSAVLSLLCLCVCDY